ncbi:LuxR C-terminal-related transcriptional regulator [Dyadobacter aurulentus]|uniref:LuxR C-terminal-related transcriptional regulator n=1 Tax=Dyadobacter sp. UC 10 TaxID=2605428 RepID=UPI0011F22017|nr:response regulator transcription factor [Dyadobacter sp. UC 10]KAA0993506.1 response regulator transcription factor [Dyadobacter sp. UC 10]
MYKDIYTSEANILLIDDHVLVAEGLRELLLRMLPPGSRADVFSSVEPAKEALLKCRYDYIFTDLNMPGQDVLGFITFCRKSHKDMIILVISSMMDSANIKACFTAGANGYLSKAIDPREIKLALEYTQIGRKYVSSDLIGRLADNVFNGNNTALTNKELEVLRLIAAGKRTKDVADLLFVSPITIMTHKRNIMKKLNLHSATELVKYVYENNLA